MSETLDYPRALAGFPFALRRFLRAAPLTLPEARRQVQERLRQREANFLQMVERRVYGWPRSPYLPLLRQAGCERGDVQALVRARGLEGALEELRQAGVYATFEEFKGRKPIRRGGLEYAARGRDFDNPLARRDLLQETGGSTGAAQAVGIDLAHVAARAAHRLLTLSAHGLLGAPTAIWQGILPHPGLRLFLWGAYTGQMPLRWFSIVGWRASRDWPKYNLATAYMIACMRLAGLRVPWPEHVGLDRALVVARWAAETAQAHGRCLVRAGVSRGARLGAEARAAGLDLRGVTLTGGGEPPTPAKVRQMTEAGARYIPNYGMSEAGQLGSGCARPADATDVHLFKDHVALIAAPHAVPGFDLTVPAFNVTALLPTAPKIMLNVQVDDYGIVEERACGCELEACGYTTHVRQVRSYSKLTGEGVTLTGGEMLSILEETLPARFGGGPQDYQLLEEEDERGLTRLYLLVHPRLDIKDEAEVAACLLAGLRQSSGAADAARLTWQQAGTIQVRRTAPIWTLRGKLLPLHIARSEHTRQKGR